MSVPQQSTYAFQKVRSDGTWRWVVSATVQPYAVDYTVSKILTPYGPFGGYGRSTDDVPLPADVVEEFAAALQQVQTAFKPVVDLSPAALTFTVDEGLGVSEPQSYTVTNTGPYGSVAVPTATTSDAYLVVQPGQFGTISSLGSAVGFIRVDSTSLTAVSSPYVATVTVADPNALASPTLSVNVVVRPVATLDVSTATVTFVTTLLPGGTYTAVSPYVVSVSNVGDPASLLQYQVKKLTGLSDWLVGFTPPSGSLTGGASASCTLTVLPCTNQDRGTYTETLRVYGYSTNSYVDVAVQLIIS